jgi:hypothetical protein
MIVFDTVLELHITYKSRYLIYCKTSHVTTYQPVAFELRYVAAISSCDFHYHESRAQFYRSLYSTVILRPTKEVTEWLT